jgi:hypothetical protein
MAKHDVLQQETLKRHMQALRLTLAEKYSSPLKGLRIDTVCSCFRVSRKAALVAAQHLQRQEQALTQTQENHLTQAQTRYVGALRALGRMRQLLQGSTQISQRGSRHMPRHLSRAPIWSLDSKDQGVGTVLCFANVHALAHFHTQRIAEQRKQVHEA